MSKGRHFKGPVGGAFGSRGSPYGGGRGDYGKRTPSSPPQMRYTSIEINQILEVNSVEATQRGDDLTVGLGSGYRVFITKEEGMAPGWSGKIKITGKNETNPKIYYAQRYVEPVKVAPAKPEPAAPATIEAKFESKVPAEYAAKPGKERETILIGDLGGTKRDSAVIYVDAKSRDMPILQALEYLIRNGTATSPQGQSILEAMKAHLDSGRPLYEVAGSIPDDKRTLGDYLNEWKQKEPLNVEVGEKEEKVKIPAATDVVFEKKKIHEAVPVTKKREREHEPMPVGAGGRRSGASLESLTGSYQVNLYHK